MSKIKDKAANLKKSLSSVNGRKLKLVLLLLLVGLLIGGGYVIIKSNSNKNSLESNSSANNFDAKVVTKLVEEGDCKEAIRVLSNMNTDDSLPFDSGNMLAFRASCYDQLKEYGKAIEDYKAAKVFWKKINEKGRIEEADQAIAYIQKVQKSPPPKPKTYTPSDELDEDFVKKLNTEGVDNAN